MKHRDRMYGTGLQLRIIASYLCLLLCRGEYEVSSQPGPGVREAEKSAGASRMDRSLVQLARLAGWMDG